MQVLIPQGRGFEVINDMQVLIPQGRGFEVMICRYLYPRGGGLR